MGKHIGFLEVGTSDFNTLIQTVSDDISGISMEPLKFYLDNLPNRSLVKKISAALVAEPTSNVDVYYIDPSIIDDPKNDLEDYMKGCNSVGKPHDFHTHYNKYSTGYKDENTIIRNLVEEGLVTIKKTLALTFSQLMGIYDLDYINTIKLDTEGQDAPLLQSILDYYQSSEKTLPKTIEFETNNHNKQEELIKVAKRLISLNYILQVGDSWYNTFENFDGKFEMDCIATLND
tara:strand:+ start:2882 stop:3577 length:696 start_codon:yes stop_codon:yes gene_type:complete